MAPSQMAASLQQLGAPLQLGMGMNNPLIHLLLLRCMAHIPLLTGGLSPTALSGLGLAGPGALPLGPQHPLMYPMLTGALPAGMQPTSGPLPAPGQVCLLGSCRFPALWGAHASLHR